MSTGLDPSAWISSPAWWPAGRSARAGMVVAAAIMSVGLAACGIRTSTATSASTPYRRPGSSRNTSAW